MSTLFTKIIQGEIPCYKIFEDELTFAFLTIAPIHLGHTLVIPKNEVDYFLDAPEKDYLKVFENAKPIGKAIHRATGCVKVGASIVGLEVPHFHLHLIPLWDASDMSFTKARQRTPEEMTAIQQKILKELKN